MKEYRRLTQSYDTKWSSYVEATVRETIARLSLRPEDRLLDVGCGTGALLSQLSARHPVSRLSGVDPVPEMLAVARRRLSPLVGLHDGWADHLPFAAEQFDVVVSCNMFHYIHKPIAALHEMKRVLRAGGQIVVTDWCDDYLACRLCDLCLRLFSRAHFKTYGQGECARLLREADYAVGPIDRYRINWLWGLMTARATRTQPDDDALSFSTT